MTDRIREARDQAEKYAKSYLRELAQEVLDWRDTGVRKQNGRLDELADILSILDKTSAIHLAESFTNRAALEAALAAAPQAAEPVLEKPTDEQIMLKWYASGEDPLLFGRSFSVPVIYAAPQPTQQPTEQDERAAFEAWATRAGLDLEPAGLVRKSEGFTYWQPATESAFESWRQAGRASLRGGK